MSYKAGDNYENYLKVIWGIGYCFVATAQMPL